MLYGRPEQESPYSRHIGQLTPVRPNFSTPANPGAQNPERRHEEKQSE